MNNDEHKHSYVCQNCDERYFLAKRARPTRRYCGRKCQGEARSKSSLAISHKCFVCPNLTTNPKFCSTECSKVAARARHDLTLAAWLRGEEPASDKNGMLRQSARYYLLREANYKCSECGWGKPNPVTGVPILTVDHVDGDWTNNYRSNLVVLCYNCHTLTPTFGALNKGSGPGRSVYSRKGKVKPTALLGNGTPPRS